MAELVLQLLLVGLAIAANNMAVSLSLGALGHRRHWARILIVFAAFEFTVPLIGVWLGRNAAAVIAGHAGWLGPLLLAGVGVLSLASAFRGAPARRGLAEVLTGWRGLIVLSAGLSVDNLAVGFGLGLGGVPPLMLALTIMICSVGFAWVGLRIGHRVSKTWHAPADFFSGVILIGLAVRAWAAF